MSSESGPDRLSDEQLASLAQSGDRCAFVTLIERWDERLFNFLLRRCARPEDAEDLTQETLVTAWAQIMRYNDRWRFSTWLFTIGGRLAASAYREASRMRPVAVDPTQLCAPQPDDPIEIREQAARLWAVADRLLTPRQRSALWLRYAEDLSISEIARVLGMTPVAIRVSLHRARRALASHENRSGARRPGLRFPTAGTVVNAGANT